MDSFLQKIYLGEVGRECEEAFADIRAVNDIVSSQRPLSPFPHLESLVNHAAAVSRIFWPPAGPKQAARERAQRRGFFLRNLLELLDDHPVRDRTLRNHFHHFDERLDDWAERSRNRNIVRDLIGPRSSIGGDTIDDADIIHHYDPAQKVYAFRGEKFEIQVLASGLDDIFARANSKLQQLQLGRYPQDGT